MNKCSLCPRKCYANRMNKIGYCGASHEMKIAKAYLHKWEEPCISGNDENRGSGTIFFSSCQLKCVFCQNFEISHNGIGKTVSKENLANIMLNLQKSGAYNINLVSPTPYIEQIIDAIDLCKDKLKIPVAMNSGGYELPETIALLKDKVKIFLPDFKFLSKELSKKYLNAENYAEYALLSIKKMIEIAGKPVFDENGIMQSGVIIRHLVMPGSYRDSIDILNLLNNEFGKDNFLLSLMSQYTPCYNAEKYKEINRRLTTFEYEKVAEVAEKLDFSGYFQQKSAANEKYIPNWDFEGVI